MAMRISSSRDVLTGSTLIRVDDVIDRCAPDLFMRELAYQFAKQYLADHYQEIVALIDQKAIATLSVAEAAAAVRETLEKKMPDKILEITKVTRR
jgi:hypothetical protein